MQQVLVVMLYMEEITGHTQLSEKMVGRCALHGMSTLKRELEVCVGNALKGSLTYQLMLGSQAVSCFLAAQPALIGYFGSDLQNVYMTR